MPRWKQVVYWWADLWPTDCVACIYLHFLICGLGIGVIMVGLMLYSLLSLQRITL